jgi:hypothetical protein
MPKVNKDFAKVFGTGRRQVVVIRRANDDGEPELRLFYDPQMPGVGVCEVGLTMKSEKAAAEAFDKCTAEEVEKYVAKVVAKLGGKR